MGLLSKIWELLEALGKLSWVYLKDGAPRELNEILNKLISNFEKKRVKLITKNNPKRYISLKELDEKEESKLRSIEMVERCEQPAWPPTLKN